MKVEVSFTDYSGVLYQSLIGILGQFLNKQVCNDRCYADEKGE